MEYGRRGKREGDRQKGRERSMRGKGCGVRKAWEEGRG